MESGPELEVPDEWRRAAERIAGESAQRILVVGRSDRGKSSFCRYLLGQLVSAFGTACFVDADIAQKDVGPPATVSLAQFGPGGEEGIDYRDGELLGLYFVGAVSPQGHFLELVVGTRQLAERAASLPTVIDTTGLITGPGLALKRAQIESLAPDTIVMIEQGHELGRLATEYRYRTLLRLSPAGVARRRSAAERRQSRLEAFRRYFSTARSVRLAWESTVIQRGRLREGLLCGLGDSGGEIGGLGVVERVERGGYVLHTPLDAEGIAIVRAGELLVDPDGSHRSLHGPRAGIAGGR